MYLNRKRETSLQYENYVFMSHGQIYCQENKKNPSLPSVLILSKDWGQIAMHVLRGVAKES